MNAGITLKWLDQRFDKLDAANVMIFKQFDQVDRGISLCLARINDIEQQTRLINAKLDQLLKVNKIRFDFAVGPVTKK